MNDVKHQHMDGKHSEATLDDHTEGVPAYAYNDGGEPVQHAGQGLARTLKPRHVAMISIGGVIGTGLFLGTANALRNGGPLGLLLGYGVMGTICYAVMCCLGEMVSFLPVPGGHIKLAGRFVDPALAFTMGWNYWYNWVVVLPAELSAAAILIDFWNHDKGLNGIWIAMCLVLVVVINMFGARAYGEAEFWFASVKVITIVCLIIVGIVIAAGGGPSHHATGFGFWSDPGPFVQYNPQGIAGAEIPGAKGRFLGFWAVLIQASFSYIGTEIVAIAAGEAENPRRNIPKAIKRVSFRILVFYMGGTFIIGLLVGSNDPRLKLGNDALGSPFVIGIQDAGIDVLPSIINFCLLTSAWSAASSDMYTSSRALYGLAVSGQAPRFFARTTKSGLPYYALAVSFAFSFLAFMGLGEGSDKVFNWFANMTSVCGLLTWMGICFTYIRFHAGVKAQNIPRSKLPYHNPFGVIGAWYAFIMIIIILLTNSWSSFKPFNTANFITSYLPIPMFLILLIGAKLVKRTRMVPASEMDFVTGVAEFEAEVEPEKKPKTRAGKVWNWIM